MPLGCRASEFFKTSGDGDDDDDDDDDDDCDDDDDDDDDKDGVVPEDGLLLSKSWVWVAIDRCCRCCSCSCGGGCVDITPPPLAEPLG